MRSFILSHSDIYCKYAKIIKSFNDVKTQQNKMISSFNNQNYKFNMLIIIEKCDNLLTIIIISILPEENKYLKE